MDAVWSLATWQIAIVACYGVVLLIAFSRHVVCSYEMRRARFLTPASARASGDEVPSVSILVPAKDEAKTIATCVRTLLAQEYPNFEVIVIDDRSGDETAQIVERIAAEDDRLRLIRVESLPDGWTGKTHALHVGQSQAWGDWLLFVDADTEHHSACLSVVMAEALAKDIDLLSMMPRIKMRSFWEKVVQPFAATCLLILFPLSRVNNPKRTSSGFANGQFILIRRDAYDRIGGHEAVRDKFVEDIHLGRRIRTTGGRLLVAAGTSLFNVRMYSSLRGIVDGWNRILYSAVDARPAKLYMLFAFICVFSVLPYIVIAGNGISLLAGSQSAMVILGLAMGIIHETCQLTLYARTYAVTGAPIRYLAYRWLAVFTMLYILARTIRICGTHAITWRGTSYGRKLQGSAAQLATEPIEWA